jgi:hypothetical protein
VTRSDAFSICTRNARAGERVNRKHPSPSVIASHSPIRAKLQHSSHASPAFTGMTLQDPEEWVPEFEAWALRECVYLDRAFGGVTVLHVAFSEWCIANRSVPSTRITFERLLYSQGFLICDGLVSALVLRSDTKAAGC